MNKALFIAGLDYSLSEDEVKKIFSNHGTVDTIKIIKDRNTRRSKGFGFIDMSTAEEAKLCIEKLHNEKILGRPLTVKYKEDNHKKQNNFHPFS